MFDITDNEILLIEDLDVVSEELEEEFEIVNEYENIIYKKVEVAPKIKMGGRLAFLDKFMGGGWMVGGSYFLTGDANAGKTTITFQMADQLTAAGITVMYNNTEMTEGGVKLVTNRLRLRNGFGLYACDTGDVEDEDLEKLIESLSSGNDKAGITPDMQLMTDFVHQCKKVGVDGTTKQVVLFIDSVQSLSENSGCTPKDIVYRFDKLAKKLKAIVIYIGQATKKGGFAGSNSLPHKVDAHIHISVIKNDGDEQIRKLTTKKNRTGPCGSVLTDLTGLGHRERVELDVE